MAKRYNYSDAFEAFWQAFPKVRRKNKPGAWKVWERDELEDVAATIQADVEVRAKQDAQWLDGFVPMPMTYLNGQGWDDEWQRKQPHNYRPTATPTEQLDEPPPQACRYAGMANRFLLKQSLRIRGQIASGDFDRHIIPARDRFCQDMRASYGDWPEKADRDEADEIWQAWKSATAPLFDRYRTTSAEGAYHSLADQ